MSYYKNTCVHCYEHEFKNSDFKLFEIEHHLESHGDVDVIWDTIELRATCPNCGAVNALYVVSEHGVDCFEVLDGELV